MAKQCLLLAIVISATTTASLAAAVSPGKPSQYQSQASEVARYIQQNFYIEKTGLYRDSTKNNNAAFMWGNGVIFPALVGACRYEPDEYLPVMGRFFKAMDRYWDAKVTPPGYEPAPTNGNGNDKYYDDNQWMVITFAEAYQLTHEQKYLQRAEETLKFSLSGWDEKLGGGIWWHEGHKGNSKNTCANAPAAVGCLCLLKWLPADQSHADMQMAVKIVDWTTQHLQDTDGLFMDNENVDTQKVARFKLTYNTALMIRANLELYRATQNSKYLEQAKRSAKAADSFLDKKTSAYHDEIKFSHLMVEADLAMWRTTHEDYLLKRARDNADHFYAVWKQRPSDKLIDNAALARMLWLMADSETEVGKKFWAGADAAHR